MPLNHDQQHDLLLKYDQEGGSEYWPEGFDFQLADKKIALLRDTIEINFGGKCVAMDSKYMQDKCVYGELRVPRHIATSDEWLPLIVLSTFGDLATIYGESALVPEAFQELQIILDQMGFQYICEAVSSAQYDGADSAINTWKQRYFDYL